MIDSLARAARHGVAALFMVSIWASAAGGPVAAGDKVEPWKTTVIFVRVPQEQTVRFQGVANFDKVSGGQFNALYPAPNVLGFFAAVITHAVIADTVQNRRRHELQESANRVLLDYRAIIDSYTSHELVSRALRLSRLSDFELRVEHPDAAGAGVVEVAMAFSMTQDKRALLLDGVFTVHAPRGASVGPTQHPVRVVSQPREDANASEAWSANEGETLKHESAALLAHALDVVLSQASGAPRAEDSRDRTFRYVEGGEEKMERARLVLDLCDRAVIRTLRNELMSIPLRAPLNRAQATACVRAF